MTDDRRTVLQMWADGQIRYGEAMARAGIDTYEGLLRAAQDCGVEWPDKLSADEIEASTRATEMLRAAALACLPRRVLDWIEMATSRAEGRELMRGVAPETRRVELDFSGVAWAAPSFGDEIWRVWAAEHPSTEVVAINVSAELYPHLRRGGVAIETGIASGSGNVFADIGLPNPDEHLVKADLALEIASAIKARGLDHAEAAQLAGISEIEIALLLRGQVRDVTAEQLRGILAAVERGATTDE